MASRPTQSLPLDWLGMLPEELSSLMEELGEPAYRGTQLFEWLHCHRVWQFDEMTNLPKALRKTLAAYKALPQPQLVNRLTAPDGTVKMAFARPGEEKLGLYETVSIPQQWGHTLCISSQIGCPVACAFCQTGMMGLRRNLTAGEIVHQLHLAEMVLSLSFRSIVFMGMGEPMLNVDGVISAIRILTHPRGRNFSARHITVSTVGIPEALEKLIASGLKVNLALSLHFPDPDQRVKEMPLTARWPLERVIELLEEHERNTGAKITLEYVLLASLNDRESDLRRLIQLARPRRWHVNLIEYNPVPGAVSYQRGFTLRPTSPERTEHFRQSLVRAGVDCTVRISRGREVAAACGQLGRGIPPTPQARRLREKLALGRGSTGRGV